MNLKSNIFRFVLLIAAAMVITGSVSAQTDTNAAISYQGYLELSGVPVTNTCDFEFNLWDSIAGGNQISTTQSVISNVNKGMFNSTVDFGATAFNGDERWLEISVRCPSGSGPYTTLTPRSAITTVPYAAYALRTTWGGIINIPAGFADGIDDTGAPYEIGNQLTLNSNILSVVEGSGSDLDADLLDGNNGSYYQTRVSGNCDVGNSVRAINADGSVTCQSVPGAIQTWNMSGWTSALSVSNTGWMDVAETTQNVTIQRFGQMLVVEFSLGFQGSGDVTNSQVAVRISIDGSPVDASISVGGGTAYVQLHGKAAINSSVAGVHQIKLQARLLNAGSGVTWTNAIGIGTTTGRSYLITLYP